MVHNSYILALVKHCVVLVQSNQSRPCTHHRKPAPGNEAVLKLKENHVACIYFANHDASFSRITTVDNSYILVLVLHHVVWVQSNQIATVHASRKTRIREQSRA
mmetsp:Transcript_79398/g.160945  ORF Transcript_79398/g.160945 Transcript_79398/m.160945 type:complete len:104 (+) Transcript_79398:532-843(+)